MTINSQIARIGVLALQGDFDAHRLAVAAAGGLAFPVRDPEQLEKADGLILPGGESTTIGKLMARYGLDTAIRAAHRQGKPIFGTCAGMILMAREIVSGEERGGQPTLGIMDISVARNAFGRQVDSFETDINAPAVVRDEDARLRGVFIRAPYVVKTGAAVDILARYEERIVLVQEGNTLAAAFHPEITGDTQLHRYFLDMVEESRSAEHR